MSDIKLHEVLQFVESLLNKTETIINSYYRNFETIDFKQDESPVTIADKEVEMELRRLIKAQYPHHSIQGEEFGIENNGDEYQWIIDPIDGTASFMIGRPIFGTLLALKHKDEVLLGCINQAITKERWLGVKGLGTRFNGNKVRVRNCFELNKAVLCTTGPNYYNAPKLLAFNEVAKQAKWTVYGGDCYNFGLLTMGFVDVVIEAGLKQHDFFPLKVLVEEAGGVITDWSGASITSQTTGDIVASGSREVHEEVLKILSIL
ncbi:MAG: inositol monophosphatase family protein [Legionella sp.]|jgi:histidinol phosphatase-like enzyme (inositol monophosphatase family)